MTLGRSTPVAFQFTNTLYRSNKISKYIHLYLIRGRNTMPFHAHVQGPVLQMI